MRLDKERQIKLEPSRMQAAFNKLTQMGYNPTVPAHCQTVVTFKFKGETVAYYPYTGWATGKTIKDGRGLNNLLKQIKTF